MGHHRFNIIGFSSCEYFKISKNILLRIFVVYQENTERTKGTEQSPPDIPSRDGQGWVKSYVRHHPEFHFHHNNAFSPDSLELSRKTRSFFSRIFIDFPPIFPVR